MSFLGNLQQFGHRFDPLDKAVSGAVGLDMKRPKPPPNAPEIPNVNDAANAAQQQRDALRARRGFLSNIYGGATNQVPATGKTQLGT